MVGNTSQLQNVTPCYTEEHVTVGNGEGQENQDNSAQGQSNQGLNPIHVAANHSSVISPWNSSTPASYCVYWSANKVFFVASEVRSSLQ
ncbi:hypothetical protein ACE6H2_000444 [Prunus campanulata]